MSILEIIGYIASGLILGGIAAGVYYRQKFQYENERRKALETQVRELQAARDSAESEKNRLQGENIEIRAKSEAQQKADNERIEELKALRTQWEQTFKAMSSDALKNNNEAFMELAKQVFSRLQESAKGDLEKRQQAIGDLVSPVKEALNKVDSKIQEIEKARSSAYSGLQEQIRNLLESQTKLQSETNNLVYALKTPNVRGRWGEVQLERTVEFAGMTEYVDFYQQESRDTETGRQRPDLIVRLPGGKNIVVDAKASLDAYLQALEAEDGDQRVALLKRHARQVRDHIKALGSKQYWRQFDPSPEFVVLFLPGEAFFSAALEQDPELIEFGASEHVLLATPTTLIALLKAVVYGWRQESIAEEAKQISALGRELYERLCTQTGHFDDMGKALKRAVEAYNKSIRSLESRVLVTARKFESLAEDSKKQLPEMQSIEETPTEFTRESEGDDSKNDED